MKSLTDKLEAIGRSIGEEFRYSVNSYFAPVKAVVDNVGHAFSAGHVESQERKAAKHLEVTEGPNFRLD